MTVVVIDAGAFIGECCSIEGGEKVRMEMLLHIEVGRTSHLLDSSERRGKCLRGKAPSEGQKLIKVSPLPVSFYGWLVVPF